MYLWKALKVYPCAYRCACYGGKSSSTWYISICQLSSSFGVLSHPENSFNTIFAFFPILTLFPSRISPGLRLYSDLPKNTKNAPFTFDFTHCWMQTSQHIFLNHTEPFSFVLGSNSCKMAVRWGTYVVLLSTIVSFHTSIWVHGALCQSAFYNWLLLSLLFHLSGRFGYIKSKHSSVSSWNPIKQALGTFIICDTLPA